MMWLIALALLLLIFLYFILLPYLRCRNLAKKYPNNSKVIFVPVIGAIFSQIQSEKKCGDPLQMYLENRKPQQKFIITNLLSRPFIMMEDELMVKDFLLNHNLFIKYSKFLFGELYFSKNIVSQNGQQWARQKKIMSKAINFEFIQKIIPQIQEIARQKVLKIKSDVPLNSQQLIFQHNAESISASFFSQNMANIKIKDSNLVSELTRLINYCIERSGQLFSILRLNLIPFSSLRWGFLLTSQERKALEQFKVVKKIIQDKVRQRIEKLKSGAQSQGDFLSYYLELYTDPNNTTIQMQQILQQFDSLLVAGSDTGAILGEMCVYCLAKYPQWYDKFEKIIDQLPQKLTLEELNKHEEFTYFIKQVSRFYPPAPFLFPRYNHKPVKLGGYEFPSGCYFTSNNKVMMNEPSIFVDPKEFRPERWSKLEGHQWSYMTFSNGPRSCLGQKLAMVNLKIILIQLIQNFQLKLNPEVPLQMTMKTLYKPKNDNIVIVTSKSKKNK